MAKLIIVPQSDWDIVKKYLDGAALVLVPEAALASFQKESAEELRRLAEEGAWVDYGFGGEPDIAIDIIHNEASFAAQEILKGTE